MWVLPNGGQPEPLVIAKDNELMEGLQMLPGGQAVLFTLTTGNNLLAAATRIICPRATWFMH